MNENAAGASPVDAGVGRLVPKRADVDRLMKRCQIGVGGRNALDNAHSIMADCYGTLGALMLAVERLRDDARRLNWLADRCSVTYKFQNSRGETAMICGPTDLRAAIDVSMGCE